MLQLRLDQLTNSFFTWGGSTLTKTVQRWPGKFNVSVKASVGTTVVQLGESATGLLQLNDAATGALLAKVASFTRVGEGAAAVYNFFLDLNSAPIFAVFSATDPVVNTIAAVMEIRFKDSDGSDVAYGSLDFTINRAQGTGTEAAPLPATVSAQSGFVRLGSGVDSGSVVFDPRMLSAPVASLALLCPAGSPLLTVNPVGSPTVDGMDWELSGPTPNGDYYLAWGADIVAGTSTVQIGVVDIDSGTDDVDVVFTEDLTAPPICRGFAVECPNGEVLLFGAPVGAPTVSGAAFKLSDDTPTTGYRLHYNYEVPA